MDPEQKERITKYGYGINITTALKKDLKKYMEIKIYTYIYENFMDYILQLLFQEVFKGFTIKNFGKIRPITKVKFYIYLL